MWSVDMAFPPFARPSSWVGSGRQNDGYLIFESPSWPIPVLKLRINFPMMPPAIMQCFTEQESMLFLPRYQRMLFGLWALLGAPALERGGKGAVSED